MPPPPKWVSVAMLIDPAHQVVRIMAVDAKGDLWQLWRPGTEEPGPPGTWQKVTPPHP